MKRKREFKTLEESILLLKQEIKSMPMTIGEILHILSGRGRALFLILLSLPFCQPLQIPGFSLPFGLTIAFIGLRMAFNGEVWLPSWILSKSIAAKTLEKILDKILFFLKKGKRLIHPRLDWMCKSPVMKVVNGIVIFFLGLFLALPLPIPFSNLVAAWSIFLIALGISKGDGIVVLVGHFVALLTVIVFIAMVATVKHIL